VPVPQFELNMKMRTKCAWCLKDMKKERAEVSPVGPECVKHLPDEIRIAILNRSDHGGEHYMYQSWRDSADAALKGFFGDSVDLIIVLSNIHWGMESMLAMFFWVHDGELVEIAERCAEPDDDLYDMMSESKVWRRRVAAMMDPRSKTKVSVKHVDAWWLYLFEDGGYYGPFEEEGTIEEWTRRNGFGHVPGACGCGALDACEYKIQMAEYESKRLKTIRVDWLRDILVRLTMDNLYRMQQEQDEWNEDIRKHPWFCENETLFDYKKHEFVEDSEAYRQAKKMGLDPPLSGEGRQAVLDRLIGPMLLLGLDEIFDEEWELDRESLDSAMFWPDYPSWANLN
jgi:hypothetical protein